MCFTRHDLPVCIHQLVMFVTWNAQVIQGGDCIRPKAGLLKKLHISICLLLN